MRSNPGLKNPPTAPSSSQSALLSPTQLLPVCDGQVPEPAPALAPTAAGIYYLLPISYLLPPSHLLPSCNSILFCPHLLPTPTHPSPPSAQEYGRWQRVGFTPRAAGRTRRRPAGLYPQHRTHPRLCRQTRGTYLQVIVGVGVFNHDLYNHR